MSLGLLILIVLIVALVGGLPNYSYSRSWGYGPSGVVGFFLIVLVVLMLTGGLGHLRLR